MSLQSDERPTQKPIISLTSEELCDFLVDKGIFSRTQAEELKGKLYLGL